MIQVSEKYIQTDDDGHDEAEYFDEEMDDDEGLYYLPPAAESHSPSAALSRRKVVDRPCRRYMKTMI